MNANVEIRKAGNEILPLLVLGLTSMALVLGMSYAVQEPDTSASIALTSRVVFAVLGGGLVAMAVVILSRGRPYDATVRAEPGLLTVEKGGRSRTLVRSFRTLYVLPEGERWSVEIERRTDTVRLLCTSRDEAEKLAGALLGTERIPTALYRLRKKADYYLFVTTVSLWVLVYAGLVAVAMVPLFGVIFTAALLPPTVWVTLRAVPTQIVVAPTGLTLFDPFRVREYPADQVASGRVVDDDTVRIDFVNGESLRLDELQNHPRDREARTSEPPAERFEAALQKMLQR